MDVNEWAQIMKEAHDRVGSSMYVPPSMYSSHTHALPNGGHTAAAGGQATAAIPPRWSEGNLQQMLASRLCWGIDAKCPFQRVLPIKVTDETVALFVVTKDDALVLKDDAKLYPSDALITQLRLLMEAL